MFRILERHQAKGGSWSAERRVSSQSYSCWTPAIAATSARGGCVAIAWDTYDKGDYDVWLREFTGDGASAASRSASS